MKKKNVLVLLSTCLWCFYAFGASYSSADLEKLRNDKEVHITVFSEKERESILEKYPDLFVRNKIGNLLHNSTLYFLNNSKLRCELNLIEILKSNLADENFENSERHIKEYIMLARSTHFIDDLYFEFLAGLNVDYHELNRFDSKKLKSTKGIARRWISKTRPTTENQSFSTMKLLNTNNTKELYSNFTSWPDEKDFCLYQELNFIKTDLKDPKSKNGKISRKRKLDILKDLNRDALAKNIITPKTYWKLEYLRRDSFAKKRYLRLEDYFNVIFKAKNQLRPISYEYEIKEIESEYNFSSERLKRFSKLTRRKKLFQKYNETQIIMLAQVLIRASRRMGVDPDVIASRPVITQTFEFTNVNGEKENYVEELVLDPRSQFNLARRRMRKDILDLEAMDIFFQTDIHYNEVVMAAFETGYLSIEDIEYAVLYDDLWNPTRSKFEKITGFIFKITGYATFFIPPPLNIPATLGVAIIEGFVQKKNIKGEDNDNAATFIQ